MEGRNTAAINQALSQHEQKIQVLVENKRFANHAVVAESTSIGGAAAGITYAATGNGFYAACAGAVGFMVSGIGLSIWNGGVRLAAKATVAACDLYDRVTATTDIEAPRFR